MPVNKTHRAIVTITFDRPITRAEALAHARHDLAGEYYLSGNQAVRRMNVEKVERLRPPRYFREAAVRGREARMPTDTRDAQAEAPCSFNVNNSVRVKLTDWGAAELKRQYDEITAMLHIDRPAWSDPRDADGYCKFQLWELMNRFGHMMTLGRVMPFDPSIELDASAIRSLASPAPKEET